MKPFPYDRRYCYFGGDTDRGMILHCGNCQKCFEDIFEPGNWEPPQCPHCQILLEYPPGGDW